MPKGGTMLKTQSDCDSLSILFQKREAPLYQKPMLLREIIKRHKINAIVSKFVNKLKRVSVLRTPVEYTDLKKFQKSFLRQKDGYELPQLLHNILAVLSIIQVISFSFIFSVSMVYEEMMNSDIMFQFQIYSCVFLSFEVLLNLFTVKYSSGKKLLSLIQIWRFYASGYLWVDLSGAVVLLASLLYDASALYYLRAVVLFKLPQCMERMDKLEAQFIKVLHTDQYWSLAKIILFNFTCMHFVSICLVAMTKLSPDSNWIIERGIQEEPWYQKYSWSCYWANTIMLTIGFGDLSATNYKEAICLIFIQTFSCMAFAYNINCVGGIINRLLAKDAERNQNSKIFTKLNIQNKLPEELSWKINNYIEETAQVRKIFNYEEEKEFINNLPVEMKQDYLKESNKVIFKHISFFKQFMSQTLYSLAEKIEIQVSHPQEIIQNIQDYCNLIILKSGSLGFVYRKPKFEVKDFILDAISVKDKSNPALISLEFITRKHHFYLIKSIGYTMYYYLPYDKFIEVLRHKQMDYQFLCTLRDKIKDDPDEFQVIKCDLCDGKHLKASCPKLHYIPYKQTIMQRNLFNMKIHKNQRQLIYRQTKERKRCYASHIYKKTLQSMKRFRQNEHFRLRNIKSMFDHISRPRANSNRSIVLQKAAVQKEIKLINQKYSYISNEIIKQEINKLIRFDNYEDQIWMLKNDILCDFNSYFPQHNPSNITNKHVQTAGLLRREYLLKVSTQFMMTSIKNNTDNALKMPSRRTESLWTNQIKSSGLF